jgi:hypothetical protein
VKKKAIDEGIKKRKGKVQVGSRKCSWILELKEVVSEIDEERVCERENGNWRVYCSRL